MAKTDLTNQRQVFVEEYVRSGDHLEAAKKAGYKDIHTLRNQACVWTEKTNPEIGRAEALRRSRIRLINNQDHPEYAHPYFWAPFVVVGEGAHIQTPN